MLVNPTVTELLKKGENRYRLVVASAKRARQIYAGSEPMVKTDDTAPVSIAADEIKAGDLKIYDLDQWKDFTNKDIDVNENEEESVEEKVEE